MTKLKLALCDTETTGLVRPPKPASGVVQVAALILDDNLNIVEEINELVNPGCPIDPKASEVHGVTEDMVRDKPSLEEVFFIEDPLMFIAHNAPFDLPRLAHQLPNCALTLCTLAAARKFILDAENHKLETLVKHLGLPQEKAHDALGDVKMTRSLLIWLCDTLGVSVYDLQKQVVKIKTLKEMPFGKHKGVPMTDLPMGYISFMLNLPDLDVNVRKSLEIQRRARGNA